MTSLQEAATDFLAQRRIAVAGVSRDPKQSANLVYRRLRDSGHEVYAINPNADTVEGDPCFPSVAALPVGVDGVVVVTPRDAAEQVVADCAAAGVKRVWLHRGIGPGSTSDRAVAACHERGISVIPGGCPNMFGECSDPGHRVMCRLLTASHKVPKAFEYGSPGAGTPTG